MISIIGLRGDKFFYEEETYNYDWNRDIDIDDGNYYYEIPTLLINLFPNALVEKGAKCMFSGTVESLSELLITLNKKYGTV